MASATVDSLDIRILRELTQGATVLPARLGFRSSYRQIAKALGISPGTARNRIQALRGRGVLTGWSVYANPNLLGLRAAAYAVEVRSAVRKAEIVHQMARLPGVLFLQNFRERLVGLAFVYETLQGREEVLTEVGRLAGGNRGLLSEVEYPPCAATLSCAEWAVIARLSQGGFESYQRLAEELGTPVRSLKRRVARLLRSAAILSVPTMDYRAIVGAVPADVLVSFDSPEVRPEAETRVLRVLEDRMIYAGVWSEFGMYSLLLPNVTSATELADTISRIPGVHFARAELVEEHLDRCGSMREFVDRRIPVSAVVPPSPLAAPG